MGSISLARSRGLLIFTEPRGLSAGSRPPGRDSYLQQVEALAETGLKRKAARWFM